MAKRKVGTDVMDKVAEYKRENREFESILNLNMTLAYEIGRGLTEAERNWVLSQL